MKLNSWKLCFLRTLFLFVYSYQVNADDALEAALLESIIPSISSKCESNAQVYQGQTSSFTFEHSTSASFWDPMAVPSEPKLFLAEMKNVNNENPNKSWTLRVGTSGNMYSFRGAYGEALPPQYHIRGEWVDEVIQSVAVNVEKNDVAGGKPYFIHQAGVYPRDPLHTDPFFSPSIANYCREKECLFGTWGQQVYLPTFRKSHLLYFNAYRDCGDGIIEHTSVFHNADPNLKNGDYLDYVNVPWGGVRYTTLRDVFFSNPDGEMEIFFPLPSFGPNRDTLRNLDDTGGYTTFAEEVIVSDEIYNAASYQMPVNQNGRSLSLRIKWNNNARKSQVHSDFWNLNCMIVEVVAPFADDQGCQDICNLWLENDRTGEKIVTPLVLHWALRVDGNYFMYFCTDESVTVNLFNQKFSKGDEINVSYANVGKEDEDNLAFTFVHGLQRDFDQRYATSRARIGKSGTVRRSYNVFTVNTRAMINPGDTYVLQQFFATGEFSEMKSIGAEWKGAVYEDLFSLGEMGSKEIQLYANDDAGTFGAFIEGGDPCLQGTSRCVGRSAPTARMNPLFSITCPNKVYLGSDRYHFSPPRDEDNIIRSYACDGEATDVTPEWKLIGFFKEGSCDFLIESSYDDTFCSTTVRLRIVWFPCY